MDWHGRYLLQAAWTRDLRHYLLSRADFDRARRVLEVGSGTGAILQDLIGLAGAAGSNRPRIHGLDISAAALRQSRLNSPAAILCNADGQLLPYQDCSFDVTCCHYLLLWVGDPTRVLREMRRITRPGGFVAAFAEPDYSARIDLPESLSRLGELQIVSLRARGANPSMGAALAPSFQDADLPIVETGTLQSPSGKHWQAESMASEREVLREDLRELLPPDELERLMQLDLETRLRGERVLQVPTYFALAQV